MITTALTWVNRVLVDKQYDYPGFKYMFSDVWTVFDSWHSNPTLAHAFARQTWTCPHRTSPAASTLYLRKSFAQGCWAKPAVVTCNSNPENKDQVPMKLEDENGSKMFQVSIVVCTGGIYWTLKFGLLASFGHIFELSKGCKESQGHGLSCKSKNGRPKNQPHACDDSVSIQTSATPISLVSPSLASLNHIEQQELPNTTRELAFVSFDSRLQPVQMRCNQEHWKNLSNPSMRHTFHSWRLEHQMENQPSRKWQSSKHVA